MFHFLQWRFTRRVVEVNFRLERNKFPLREKSSCKNLPERRPSATEKSLARFFLE